jgi:hypothetical protein
VTPGLRQSLEQAAALAAEASDPWWIIGSAAVWLHGGDVGRVKDIDLMMSSRDAESFLRRAGVEPKRGKASDRFRSTVFAVWSSPPVPVEVFGGFELATDGGWRPVVLATRQAISVGHSQVFVPSADELVRLLHAFGRAKDLERVAVLGKE